MILRRFLILAPLVVALVLMISFFWVPTYEEQTRGNPERLSQFITTSSGDAAMLNPILSADSASSQINGLVFEGLIDRAARRSLGDAEAKMTVMVLDDIKSKHRMAVRKVDGGMIAEKDGGLLTFVDTSQARPLDVHTDEDSTTLLGTLPAGGRIRCVGYIPAWKLSPQRSLRNH